MKNFKQFKLDTKQQINTVGKGKPEWAGIPAHKRNGEDYINGGGDTPRQEWLDTDGDGEYENPYDTGDDNDVEG